MDAKQRGMEIYFYKTERQLEVDFVIKQHHVITPLQVAWNIHDEKTLQREVAALSATLDELRLERGVLITMDDEISYPVDDRRITHIAAYEWLLRVS